MGIIVAQSDIENVYGVNNVRRWSQLDQDSKQGDATRIALGITNAESKFADRFRNSVYIVPACGTSATYTNWIATLAGVWLYQNRGVRDAEAEGATPLDIKMIADHDAMMLEMDAVLSGSRELSIAEDVDGPTAPIVLT